MQGTGPRSLRLLWRLKLRGALRRQVRRLRTWKGALLSLVGGGLFALWIFSLAVRSQVVGDAGREVADPEDLVRKVGLGALVLTTITLSGAFAHRGLFIPKDEIERLLSAPVSRRDLIRYRLRANSLRNLFGGLVVGLMAARHMPQPGLAFVGVLVGMQTIAVLHQLLAILLGGLERRVGKFLQRFGMLILRILIVGIVLLVALPAMGFATFLELPFVQRLTDSFAVDFAEQPLAHPIVVGIVAPFAPWSRMITAGSPAEFLPWLGLSLALLFAALQLTMRVPIDFRELSLATSASMAARIRRARIGGGAAAGRASRRMAGWSVPWLFGHGVGRAVIWRKSCSILRKARGTLFVSVLVLGFVTMLSTLLQDSGTPTWFGPLLIAGIGTLYLCAGLRFDFRDELDRMEVLRAWPIPPTRLFLCMLLPEAVLVTGLLVTAILLRFPWAGGVHPITFGILAMIPLVVFAWIALDNAVFLFAPVRFVPGQDGALQNAGRGLLMLLLRFTLLAVVALIGGGAYALALVLAERFDLPNSLVLISTFSTLFSVLLLTDIGLVAVGGWVLRRFDVSRDHG